jgi:hypothetical protein
MLPCAEYSIPPPAFQPAGFLIVSTALHFSLRPDCQRHHQAKAIAALAMIKWLG